MTPAERDRFDAIVERVVDEIPPRYARILEVTPIIIEDQPSPELCKELDLNLDEEILCGLHTGTPITERSVLDDGAEVADVIHLFRDGILEEADGWDQVEEQIRITLLHEIGHHYGLDEDDLDELGFA